MFDAHHDTEFLKSLRINDNDIDSYQKSDDSTKLKIGHMKRIRKALNKTNSKSNSDSSKSENVSQYKYPYSRDVTSACNQIPILTNGIETKSAGNNIFNYGGFHLSSHGIDVVPISLTPFQTDPSHISPILDSQQSNAPRFTRDASIILSEIGIGGSSQVYKALYVPNLTLLAIKTIQLNSAVAPMQTVSELKALYSLSRHSLEANTDTNSCQLAKSNNSKSSLNYLYALWEEISRRICAICFCEIIALSSLSFMSIILFIELKRQPITMIEYLIFNFPVYCLLANIIWTLLGDQIQKHESYLEEINTSRVAANQYRSCTNEESKQCLYIVKFYDAYVEPVNKEVCIVLEYMSGGSLQNLIDKGIKLDENNLAIVAYSVLQALIELHKRNIIHRDIKPGNILYDHYGNVKLSDFGIVKELSSTGSLADTFTGTLSYMSPERIKAEKYSFKSDIWSLGMTITALTDASAPFSRIKGYWALVEAIQNNQINLQGLSGSLSDFIYNCLKYEPSDRLSAFQLIEHDFIKNAITTGIINPPIQPKLINMKVEPESFDSLCNITDRLIQWQIQYYDNVLVNRKSENDHSQIIYKRISENRSAVPNSKDDRGDDGLYYDTRLFARTFSSNLQHYSADCLQAFGNQLQIHVKTITNLFELKSHKLDILIYLLIPTLMKYEVIKNKVASNSSTDINSPLNYQSSQLHTNTNPSNNSDYLKLVKSADYSILSQVIRSIVLYILQEHSDVMDSIPPSCNIMCSPLLDFPAHLLKLSHSENKADSEGPQEPKKNKEINEISIEDIHRYADSFMDMHPDVIDNICYNYVQEKFNYDVDNFTTDTSDSKSELNTNLPIFDPAFSNYNTPFHSAFKTKTSDFCDSNTVPGRDKRILSYKFKPKLENCRQVAFTEPNQCNQQDKRIRNMNNSNRRLYNYPNPPKIEIASNTGRNDLIDSCNLKRKNKFSESSITNVNQSITSTEFLRQLLSESLPTTDSPSQLVPSRYKDEQLSSTPSTESLPISKLKTTSTEPGSGKCKYYDVPLNYCNNNERNQRNKHCDNNENHEENTSDKSIQIQTFPNLELFSNSCPLHRVKSTLSLPKCWIDLDCNMQKVDNKNSAFDDLETPLIRPSSRCRNPAIKHYTPKINEGLSQLPTLLQSLPQQPVKPDADVVIQLPVRDSVDLILVDANELPLNNETLNRIDQVLKSENQALSDSSSGEYF